MATISFYYESKHKWNYFDMTCNQKQFVLPSVSVGVVDIIMEEDEAGGQQISAISLQHSLQM